MANRRIGESGNGNTVRVLAVVLVAVSILAYAQQARAQDDSVVRMVYFYRDDCSHCVAVIEEVLKPLQAEYGVRLQIRMVQFGDPEQTGAVLPAEYELLIRAEEMYGVLPGERGIPTLIVGGDVLIGEDEIRDRLRCVLDSCLAGAGTSWPDIPGLEGIPVGIGNGDSSSDVQGVGAPDECQDDGGVCPVGPPEVWLVYFSQAGCDECDRAWSDIQYVTGKYPQLMVESFDIIDRQDLAVCLAERTGRQVEFGVPAPAIFVGGEVLIGRAEITPRTLDAAVQEHTAVGTGRFWEVCADDPPPPPPPPPCGWVILGGLLDGLNPCAFATMIFFISYLTVTERRGREILAVGLAFTVGVFVTYLGIGLGLYKVVKSISTIHTVLGYALSLLIALLCVVLAVLSFKDYLKAREGDITGMALVMPEGLRRFTHSVIRRTSNARAFVIVAFVTGAVISFVELACTGTPLLATIVYVANNVPDSRAHAVLLLVLFCLAFILPLVVVFVLVYFGTTSLQLGLFLKRRAALVKLGTALLFVTMAIWLAYTAVPGLVRQFS